MPDPPGINPLPLPPQSMLIQMGNPSVARVIQAAAKLGLADHLESGPRNAKELAGPLRANAPALHRFMRSLAGLGVLTQTENGRYALTPLGDALRTNAPRSARPTLLMMGSELPARAFDHFVHSLQTGKTGTEKAWGMPFFEYLEQHPEEASLFSQTMVGFHGGEPPAVAAAYDFAKFSTIVDVGGATGNLLAAILARHDGPRGVLFDRPYVVADAPAFLSARGVKERVAIEAGDFFEKVPTGGDGYLLSHIVHDWDEETCLKILGNCRAAMNPDGRLLIIEMVIPEGDGFHPAKLLDMAMLVLMGGEERTEAEYGALLGKAGFRLSGVTPTQSEASIVEALPA